ncbi:MAG: BON domain-containing protein, partial [Polyangiaceae bacterium]
MRSLAIALIGLACAGCHRGTSDAPDATVSLSFAQVEMPLDDAAITRAVQSRLREDRAASREKIEVSTSQGITTLFATVKNLLAKEHAVAVAETIRGVRAVVDQISVAPAPRPDKLVQREVETALGRDPATKSNEIT